MKFKFKFKFKWGPGDLRSVIHAEGVGSMPGEGCHRGRRKGRESVRGLGIGVGVGGGTVRSFQAKSWPL